MNCFELIKLYFTFLFIFGLGRRLFHIIDTQVNGSIFFFWLFIVVFHDNRLLILNCIWLFGNVTVVI